MLSLGHTTTLDLLAKACPEGSVVDAGAFPGNLTKALAQKYRVIALDKDPDRVLDAQTVFHTGRASTTSVTFAAEMARLSIQTLATDLELDRWPLDSDSVDAIVLTEVIEHMYANPIHALLEANRVLRTKGTMLLSTPNLLSLRNRFNFLRGRMGRVIQPPFLAFLENSRLGHPGHIRLYAPGELQDMLQALGFDSELHFYQFDYWDRPPASNKKSAGQGEPDPAPDATPKQPTTTVQRRPLWRRLIRSPKSYCDAAVATMRTMLEARIPQFRPHMFVVATKVRDVTDAELSVAAFKAMQQSKGPV